MQTKSYAADTDGIHTKNNMSPTPSEGGHNRTELEFNPFMTNGLAHYYQLHESTFIFRAIRTGVF